MTYLEFRSQWHVLGYFNIRQIYAWKPDFNRHNLIRWVKKGYIVRLRKDFYAFADFRSVTDFPRYLANRIYRPSYISLHSALAFYGMIPEAIVQQTSVTPLKTAHFTNDFGEFIYKSIKPDLMFGYVPKSMSDGRVFYMATPEKALIDLLYLNPYYKSKEDMLNLRLDEDFLTDGFNTGLFTKYADRTGNIALLHRVKSLISTYNL